MWGEEKAKSLYYTVHRLSGIGAMAETKKEKGRNGWLGKTESSLPKIVQHVLFLK